VTGFCKHGDDHLSSLNARNFSVAKLQSGFKGIPSTVKWVGLYVETGPDFYLFYMEGSVNIHIMPCLSTDHFSL